MLYNKIAERSDNMLIMESKYLKECLDDFGCNDEEKAEILNCHDNGNIKGMIILLRKHRQSILNTIHNEEKQIICLDYFIFQLEKNIEANQ